MTILRRFFISAVFLFAFFAGCNFMPGQKVYTYAEQLPANGENWNGREETSISTNGRGTWK